MKHDTGRTRALIQRHLAALAPALYVVPAEEHDGRDSEPVAAVEVSGVCEVYPIEVTRPALLVGSVMLTRWCVDLLEDVSDPETGEVGYEPAAHTDHDSLTGALVEVARLLTGRHVRSSLESGYPWSPLTPEQLGWVLVGARRQAKRDIVQARKLEAKWGTLDPNCGTAHRLRIGPGAIDRLLRLKGIDPGELPPR